MANLTLYVPDSLRARMNEFKGVRWSAVVRSVVEEKISDFEAANALAAKSVLTVSDVERLTRVVNASGGRHAEELLNETSG
ncbi:MAG: hypothetical protein WC607_02925 [Candidatus Micrarchaeia archaeon]